MITIKGRRIYFAGDTGYSRHFSQIKEKLGSPDLALLPIGAYEPYWFMKTVHMNPADAVQAHIDLDAKQSIAMHFGTFKLTTEAWDQPAKELHDGLLARKVAPSTFSVPIEGASFFL